MTLPPLVYAAETPLTEMQTAELFVVTSLRLWVRQHRLGDLVVSGLRPQGLDAIPLTGYDA